MDPKSSLWTDLNPKNSVSAWHGRHVSIPQLRSKGNLIIDVCRFTMPANSPFPSHRSSKELGDIFLGHTSTAQYGDASNTHKNIQYKNFVWFLPFISSIPTSKLSQFPFCWGGSWRKFQDLAWNKLEGQDWRCRWLISCDRARQRFAWISWTNFETKSAQGHGDTDIRLLSILSLE